MSVFICIIVVMTLILIIGKRLFRMIVIHRLMTNFGQVTQHQSYAEINQEYYRQIKEPTIDSHILEDLEVPAIFDIVNHTYSEVGREYLYGQFFQSGHRHDFLEHLICQFEDKRLLKGVIYELYELSAHYQESLDFFSHFEFFSPLDIVFALISVVCPVLLIFFALMGYDVFVWVLLWLALQSSIYARYLRREDRIFSRALSYCQVVHTLKKLNDKGIFLPQDETLIKSMTHRALKYTYIYRFCTMIEKYDVYYLMELLKSIFSLPIFQCFLLIKHRDILQADYLRIYEYVGIVDLAVSVLSLRNDYDTCIPLLSKQPQVSFQAGYHPVFENPVKNSFTINESCMITGSNASGKSTFLKIIGLNLLLAQSIHTCFADEMTYYPFHLCTSIHIKDDINSGESEYVKEIKILKAIVDEVKTKHCFVLVDEILRGTNEYERMKIARAILDYVKDHQLYWDYKIHESICRVGNAIALLEACEMDETILENIRKVS